MPGQFDTWDSYFWEPGGTVLRNLYGERDGAALAHREYRDTQRREREIASGRVDVPRTYDAAHLRAIHGHLFQDVYGWAGEYRSVNTSKGGSTFAAVEHIDMHLGLAATLLHGRDWTVMDREDFAIYGAITYSFINQAHPFREGNGRAAKLFMQQVAERSGVFLDYARVSPEQWNEAARLSAPKSGEVMPESAELGPIFMAIATELPGVAPPPDLSQGSSRVRSSYPRRASEATRQSPLPSSQPYRSGPSVPGRGPAQGRGE